jgi:hypothetical protein
MAMGYLIATGAGCLVFTHGFNLVARNETGSDPDSFRTVEWLGSVDGKRLTKPEVSGSSAIKA